MIALFVIFHGLAWGARGPLMQALRADYFSASSFGFIMGLSSLIVMLGTVLGPIIAGVLAGATSYPSRFCCPRRSLGYGHAVLRFRYPDRPTELDPQASARTDSASAASSIDEAERYSQISNTATAPKDPNVA